MNLIVTNLSGESLPLLDYRPPMRTRDIDGTHMLSVTVRETPKNKRAFDLIEAEGKLSLDNNTYRIKQMQRDVRGIIPQTEITALHTFFDIIHNYQYDVIEGETVLSLHRGLTFAFENTDITFIIEDEFDTISFENFGEANSLNLFEKLRTSFDFEFTIENDTFLRIRKRIGSQTQAQMRWKHNIKAIKEEVDTTNLATYIKGHGKPKEDSEGNPIEGEYVVQAEYTSPKAHLYEKLYHADPIYDERFTHENALLKYMVSKIIDEPELSYTIEYEELQKTGVESLELGDLAFLIHEVLRLDFNTRVVEVIDFPTLPKRKPIYTISSKKESMTDKQVKANADKKALEDDIRWSKNRQSELDKRLEKVVEAVADVENAMIYVESEMERLENEVIPEIDNALDNTMIPNQPDSPDPIPTSKLWWDTSVNPPRFMRYEDGEWIAAVTSGSLNINEIFSNHAIIAKIQADSVLTAELDATKIVTGTLNAKDVSIINLSASSIISGTLDASKVRVRNLDASEINAGELNAINIYGSTITGSRLIGGSLSSLNNNTNFNLDTGNLFMQNAEFILRNGAEINFTDPRNTITYFNARYAGLGVGNSAGGKSIVFMGTTRAGSSFTARDESDFSGFVSNSATGAGEVVNTVAGEKFRIRNNIEDIDKGFEFRFIGGSGPAIFMPIRGQSTYASIGSSSDQFEEIHGRQLYGAVQGSSSITLKDNVEQMSLEDSLQFIKNTQVVKFDWIKDIERKNDLTQNKQVSFILEDLKMDNPHFVKSSDINYKLNNIIFMQQQVIQNLLKRVENLEGVA